MHREPKSKVFVLQATMRCLRAITDAQQTARIYLSKECETILRNELDQNFRVSLEDLTKAGGQNGEQIEVRVVPPPVKIKINRVQKFYRKVDKKVDRPDLKLSEAPTDQYKITVTERSITNLDKRIGPERDVSDSKEKRVFSELSLVAEVARYLNISPIRIATLLRTSEDGMAAIVTAVNGFNELLYDWVIPRLFSELYDLQPYERKEELEIELVKPPKDGYFLIRAKPDRVANNKAEHYAKYQSKSFHLSDYCFDSMSEFNFFNELLEDKRIDKVWFTGMLTHGQSDFCIPYIDPESHVLRTYYPDFLVQLTDKSFVMFEVKADNQIDDLVVQAKKKWANEMASASAMRYEIIPSSQAEYGWPKSGGLS